MNTPSVRTGAHDVFLIAWVALIGADRIDLAGGDGAFLLTPFLAMTPLVAASELRRRQLQQRPVWLTQGSVGFIALVLTLLVIVGASVLVSQDTATSANRALLLAAQVTGTIAVVLGASDRPHLKRLFERGAVAGILLFLFFDVMQIASLLGLGPDLLRVGPATFDFVPSTYGGFVPRLSGTVADQNRSGLVLLFYAWFVGARGERPARGGLLLLVALMMAATLSRSAALAALATLVVVVVERRVGRISAGALFTSTMSLAAVLLVLLASPQARRASSVALAPLASRFSFAEGSSQVHFTLIDRGMEVGTASVARVALGLGYGSAYTVLQDVFPGNRYGSFHSLYVTMFAETGVAGLLCVLLLFGVPLVRGGPYRPLLAGAAVFNLFYQATNDPALWAILVLAWMTMPPFSRVERGARSIATATPA